MIFGIGVDVLKAQRMADMLEKYGERAAERILMPEEMAQYKVAKRPARFLGMRFAAKEAIVKALGTGFAHGVWVRDVGVVANEWGRPEVVFSARGDRLRRRLGAGEGYVTLTDEEGLIVAVAVLMRARVRDGVAEPRGKARRAASGKRGASTASARSTRGGKRAAGSSRKKSVGKSSPATSAVAASRVARAARPTTARRRSRPGRRTWGER